MAKSSTSSSARCATWSRTRRSRRTRSSRRPSGPTPRPKTFCARSTATRVRDNPETGLKKGDLIRKVSDLEADGSTSSGAWIYAGVFAGGENLSKRRDSKTDPGGLGLYPGFGWTWPNNMRILYNRASCDKDGKPYPGSKPIVWWDEKAKRWTGHDVPDVPVATDGPDTPNGQRAVPPRRRGRRPPLRGRLQGPRPEVHGLLARRRLRAEGRPAAGDVRAGREPGRERPAPAREEQPDAQVSARPVASADRHGRQVPVRADDVDGRGTLVRRFDDAQHSVAQRARCPSRCWSCRPRLAKKLEIESGDWVKVSSARGELEVKALVTPRMKALKIGGQEVTVVWMPYNWGFQGLSTGAERQPPHDRRRRSRRGNAGDQGVPRQRRQGRPPGLATDPASPRGRT